MESGMSYKLFWLLLSFVTISLFFFFNFFFSWQLLGQNHVCYL